MSGARVCGNCYVDIRPDEYEPAWSVDGTCDRCGQYSGGVHRVRWNEIIESVWTAETAWSDDVPVSPFTARALAGILPASDRTGAL